MGYRVGVSGTRRGRNLARVLSKVSGCEVTAACDPAPERLEAFGCQFPGARLFSDYGELLNAGLDIVVVASPVPMHSAQSVAALQAGCHVLQEVTLGQTVAECREILDAVKEHPKQVFMLAENCCFWAHITSWKEMFGQGALGDFVYAEAEYIHDCRRLMRQGDGSLSWRATLPPIHYCTHSLGPLLRVTGERCVTACGLAAGTKTGTAFRTPDMEVGIFQTASGGVIKILTGFKVVREPAFHYYSVYGTRGCLETSRPPADLQTHAYLDGVPNLHGMIEMPLNIDVPDAPEEARLGGHGSAEYYMVEAFIDAVRGGGPSPIGIYQALDMALPGLCAHESALQGGRPVPIPDWR